MDSKRTKQVQGLQSGTAEESRDRARDQVTAWVQRVYLRDRARGRTGHRDSFRVAQAVPTAMA